MVNDSVLETYERVAEIELAPPTALQEDPHSSMDEYPGVPYYYYYYYYYYAS